MIPYLYFIVLTTRCFVRSEHDEVITRKVPANLLLGVASSSYQCEGAWNEDGKGENIWDRFVHTRPDKIHDQSNGDIACDSYHKTKEDVALIKELGSEFYRFSISWSRILPTGLTDKVNQPGIRYYNNLINELLANNIIPMVTMFHWDLPQPLQDLGGWTNSNISNWFKDYAAILFDNFGDRVKIWITINEPKQICYHGYGIGVFAPGIESSGKDQYICTKNLLMAHAHAYHLYDKVYRPTQKGRIGLAIECTWSEAGSNDQNDLEAAERNRQFDFGIYTHPVYHKDGDFPKIVKQFISERSKEEGLLKSRLPEFTTEEICFIKGTYDFFGLNHYTTLMVEDRPADSIGEISSDKDVRVKTWQDPKWLTGTFGPFRLVPWGFRKTINYIKENYGNPEIMITESGFPDKENLDDVDRIRFYKESINALIDAIEQDHVNVTAYTAWCLMDNFEWAEGYSHRFGLIHVDFNDPNRKRTLKSSFKFYSDLIKTRNLVINKKLS